MNTERKPVLGFTMVELLVAMVVVALLAMIAVPAYSSFIVSSRAKDAAADLMSLSLNFESYYQLQLQYPVNTMGTIATPTNYAGWHPTASQYFSYTVSSSSSNYTLTATGSGSLNGCVLTLDNSNIRTATGQCGFSTW